VKEERPARDGPDIVTRKGQNNAHVATAANNDSGKEGNWLDGSQRLFELANQGLVLDGAFLVELERTLNELDHLSPVEGDQIGGRVEEDGVQGVRGGEHLVGKREIGEGVMRRDALEEGKRLEGAGNDQTHNDVDRHDPLDDFVFINDQVCRQGGDSEHREDRSAIKTSGEQKKNKRRKVDKRAHMVTQ